MTLYLRRQQGRFLPIVKLVVFTQSFNLRNIVGDLVPELWYKSIELLKRMDLELVIILFEQGKVWCRARDLDCSHPL